MIASPEPSSQAFLTEPVPIPVKPAKFRFSKETASEYGKRGGQANGKRIEEAKGQIASDSPDIEVNRYKNQRLIRVRKQLDVLQDCFDDALAGTLYVLAKTGLPVQVFDPQHIDRIAAAIARVAELERQLADWPLPGSKKPRPERSQRGSGSTFEPVEE